MINYMEVKFYKKYTIAKIREIDGHYIWIRLPKVIDNCSFKKFDDIFSGIFNDIVMDGQEFPITENRKKVKNWVYYAGTLRETVIVEGEYIKYEDFTPLFVYASENGLCTRYVNKKEGKTLYYFSLPVFFDENDNRYVFYSTGIPQGTGLYETDKYLGKPRATFTGLSGKKLMINLPIVTDFNGKPIDDMPRIITTESTETEIPDYLKNIKVNAIGEGNSLGNVYEEGTDFSIKDGKLTINPKAGDDRWIVSYDRKATEHDKTAQETQLH